MVRWRALGLVTMLPFAFGVVACSSEDPAGSGTAGAGGAGGEAGAGGGGGAGGAVEEGGISVDVRFAHLDPFGQAFDLCVKKASGRYLGPIFAGSGELSFPRVTVPVTLTNLEGEEGMPVDLTIRVVAANAADCEAGGPEITLSGDQAVTENSLVYVGALPGGEGYWGVLPTIAPPGGFAATRCINALAASPGDGVPGFKNATNKVLAGAGNGSGSIAPGQTSGGPLPPVGEVTAFFEGSSTLESPGTVVLAGDSAWLLAAVGSSFETGGVLVCSQDAGLKSGTQFTADCVYPAAD